MFCASVILLQQLTFCGTGTDFCRHTPRIGAHRMWELLPLVLRKTKLDIFKEGHGGMLLVDEDVVCDTMMSLLYAEVYSNHVKEWDRKGFEGLSRIIKRDGCKLSQTVKDDFPTLEMLATTVRNVSWNMLYWVAAANGDMTKCPCPVHPMYGYAMDEKGKPQYLDIVMQQSQKKKKS